MVKFSRDEIQSAVLRVWKEKAEAPIVFYIGKGALHWLIWDGENYIPTDEVIGLTDEQAKAGVIDESLFLLDMPRLIQVKTESITIQLMDDIELNNTMMLLNGLRKSNPKFVPYDREYEVCEIEREHRKRLRESMCKKRKRAKPSEGDGVPGDGSGPIVAG